MINPNGSTSVAKGSIEPEVPTNKPQVTVQTSALVDDLGAMTYQVYDESVSIFFGRGNDDSIHIGFTDQSLLNLAQLVNRAVCAMLQARGIPIPAYIGKEQSSD
jgi:hypothetical protein